MKNAVNPIHKAIQKTIYFGQSLHQCWRSKFAWFCDRTL